MQYVYSPSRLISIPVVLAALALCFPGLVSRVAAFSRFQQMVSMDDACDPETFNAAVGPGTCQRAGGVRFEQFLSLIEKHGSIGAWHFSPPTGIVDAGSTLVAINRGGEVHTFTEVDEFGGGIVPLLNDLSGNPTVAPECTRLEDDDFVPPGGTYSEDIDSRASGTIKIQCCIHPWMRMEAHVR